MSKRASVVLSIKRLCIVDTAQVCQISVFVHTEPSNSGVMLHQFVNSYSSPALRIQKRCDGDVCVFFTCNITPDYIITQSPSGNKTLSDSVILSVILWLTKYNYIFFSCKLPKTLPGTTLLLFGPVKLLCFALLDIWIYYVEQRFSLVIRLWTTSDQHLSAPCSRLVHSHRGRFASAVPLILHLETHQSVNEFHPSLHLKPSHRRWCRELMQDPCTQRAVWMGLVFTTEWWEYEV